MITVCVPVLKRYDLLRDLIESLETNPVPCSISIIDNGRNDKNIRKILAQFSIRNNVFTPIKPMGVAESWNWFIKNVPEERLISNDDIVFSNPSLMAMTESKAPFVSCSFGFSCFIIRDICIEKVGLFDETLSPGYAYFEDMDYLKRMKIAGIKDEVIQCDVVHRQSQTPAQFTSDEWKEHHRRFSLAESNYTAKWKDGPSWDQLAMIGGNGAHVD